MSSATIKLFVAQLRASFEKWHSHEIDYATLCQCQSDTWRAICAMGQAVEAAVLREISTGTALLGPAGCSGSARRRGHLSGGRPHRAHRDSDYQARIERTATGHPILQIFRPAGRGPAAPRALAALLYEIAADMERFSQILEAHWAISPEPYNDRIVVEVVSDDDISLAYVLLVEVIQLHELA